MSKFNVVVCDPPYNFSDKLVMSTTKRGAQANYPTLSIEDIKALKVPEIVADNALLALWVPSSLLQEGLDIMSAWGFRQVQTHIWIKIKLEPMKGMIKTLRYFAKRNKIDKDAINIIADILNTQLDLNEFLSFGLGRLFRNTHEICLIGVKGKIYNELKDKSQRSVHFDINRKHSAKPEILQDRLEIMFPDPSMKKLELFARRSRKGWITIGNENPDTMGEDIRGSIEKLIAE